MKHIQILYIRPIIRFFFIRSESDNAPISNVNIRSNPIRVQHYVTFQTLFFYSVNFVPVNETLADKLGTHEAAFYQLINDKVGLNLALVTFQSY